MKRYNGTQSTIGQRVSFTNRFGDKLTGTIVKEAYWAHCLGACDVTVFATDGNLYGLPMFSGAYTQIEKSSDPETNLAAAREAYHAHLSQYPIWAKRFEEYGLSACGF